jgi:trimeric autotransporter adhesin
MRLLTILLLCAVAVGCGYGSSYNSSTGGTGGTTPPTISQLSPSSTASGGPAFTLTIVGTEFTTGSVVYWGTTPLTTNTTYMSTSQVTANITAAMIANPGSISVYVHSAGGNSNSMTFTIN